MSIKNIIKNHPRSLKIVYLVGALIAATLAGYLQYLHYEDAKFYADLTNAKIKKGSYLADYEWEQLVGVNALDSSNIFTLNINNTPLGLNEIGETPKKMKITQVSLPSCETGKTAVYKIKSDNPSGYFDSGNIIYDENYKEEKIAGWSIISNVDVYTLVATCIDSI